MRRGSSIYARPVVALLFLAVIVHTHAAQAQSGENWLLPVTEGRIAVGSLTGGDPFAAVPQMRIEFAPATNPGLALTTATDVYFASGDVLEPVPGSDYCTIILAGSNTPVTVQPDRPTATTFTAYCLQLPDEANGRKPDANAAYAPIAYRGVVDIVLPNGQGETILEILRRARANNLVDSYGTQLAVWAASAGLTDEQLAVRLNFDLAEFAPELALLRADAAPTPAATAVLLVGTPMPDLASPSQPLETPNLIPVPDWLVPVFGSDGLLPLTRSSLLLVVGVGVALLIIGSGGLAYLRSRRTVRRPARGGRLGQQPVTGGAQTANAPSQPPAPPPVVEPAWSSRTRDMLKNQQPKVVVRSSGRPMDPNATGDPAQAARPSSRLEPPLPPVGANPAASFMTPQGGPDITPVWPTPYGTADDTGFLIPYSSETGDLSGFLNPTGYPTKPPRRTVEYVLKEENGHQVGNSLGFEGGLLTRGPIHHQIVLSEPGFSDVSAPHALLRIRDGQITLRDLRSRNGTRVGNDILVEHDGRVLYDGAIITIGRHRFQLDATRRALISQDANERGRVRSLGTSAGGVYNILITRRHLNALVVPSNPAISTPHLLIRPEHGSDENQLGIQVRDLRALHPTLIGRNNDLRQQDNGRYSGRNGMRLTIGQTVYVLRATRDRPLTELGAYRIVGEDGIYRSNMAAIYRVKDAADAPFAAKVFDVYQSKTEIARRAFELEMELMRQLGPRPEAHVLDCLDSGVEDSENAPYFIMKLLAGRDLDQIMKSTRRHAQDDKGPRRGLALPDIKAMYDIVLQAVECLHTHEDGYVHCDLKPSNIYIDRSGTVFLLDLGIVVRRGGKAEFGTTYYSAPEVLALRSGIDCSADIYSLGAILFEVLTGRGAKYLVGEATEAPTPDDPHTDEGPQGYHDPNPHPWLKKAGPMALDFLDVIRTATDQEPERRYSTVAEFRAALDNAYARSAAATALHAGPANLKRLVLGA